MTSVFIGGSRRIVKLNPEIADRLQNIISNNLDVLIGDANGFDRIAQEYFAQHGYKNVLVYCSSGVCRNNLGGWNVKTVDASGKRVGFDFYTVKDDAMLADANFGLFAWDGSSRGTLRNVTNMVQAGKPSAVYVSSTKSFSTVKTLEDLQHLVTPSATAGLLQAPLFSSVPNPSENRSRASA